jgi:hypothetical protein
MSNKRTPSPPPDRDRTSHRRSPETRTRLTNLGLAAIAGQAGCITLVIVFAALFIGLGLDSRFGQRGPFTFILICLSVPVSLFAMLRLTLSALARINPQPIKPKAKPPPPSEEE